MRGRYRSRLVDDEEYLLEVLRYIHINPVEAELVVRAGDYRWSSHRHYLTPEAPKWLERSFVFRRFDWDADGVVAFDEFVHERIPDEVREKLEATRWKPVVGSAAFEERWARAVRERGIDRQPELVDARRLAALEVEQVMTAACVIFDVEITDLQRARRGNFNAPRQLALLVCREYCRASNRELGRCFNVSGASVPNLVRRARARVRGDPDLRARMRALVQRLAQMSQVST